ncbi:tripartite tricarboxylate transporter substrate-binding protein [Paeniroseomonas aquatica]|uniref:tripartite tricarboxylate transporter substrate-binding protein n=1 Tax=Paeniroseomonas aquatica TaxID=373043 RepID=UPI0033907149
MHRRRLPAGLACPSPCQRRPAPAALAEPPGPLRGALRAGRAGGGAGAAEEPRLRPLRRYRADLAGGVALEFLHVPYRSAGQAVGGLHTGEIDLDMGDLGLLLPHVRDGRSRLLAVTPAQRVPEAPATRCRSGTCSAARAARRPRWRRGWSR